MKVSIVTISFNQGQFLERTIRSVIEQDYPDLEYIVVDPGSTDGSRDIIELYRNRITHIVYEPDNGAADGLNRGFALATGAIYGFLNSDDILLPNAISDAVGYLKRRPNIDVISGNCLVIDSEDRVLRKAYSDKFTLRRYAYGASVLVQPSTFFRAVSFWKTGGFNIENRCAWDGELFVQMLEQGSQFARANKMWSGYRIHKTSITASAKMRSAAMQYHHRIFSRIIGREMRPLDKFIAVAYRLLKHGESPRGLYERLVHGPVYGRLSQK